MEEKEKKERNFMQRIAYKIAQGLKTVLRVVFLNPLPWVILTAIVFGRFYELGYFGMKGSTVLVTGVCENKDGYRRANIAQDQVIISTVSNEHIEGVIRRTREYVKCEVSNISVDRVGTIRDLFKWDALIPLPEISKLDTARYERKNYAMYLNKDILVSGTCSNPQTSKPLDPFREMVISVTNIKESKEEANSVYFYGVRSDNQPVVCDSKDITYRLIGKQEVADKQDETNKIEDVDPVPVSYIGQKVFVTGICIPDYRAYRALGTQPKLKNYNMQKTPIEVIEEEINPVTGKVIKLVGSVLDKTPKKIGGETISVLGHKVKCDSKTFPMIVVPSTDKNVEIEESAVNTN